MKLSIPKFSVITPCYNSLLSLQETLQSVVTQESADFEYLIVDGASTDGTEEWLQQHPFPRVRWTSEPDFGVYDAMNKGISMAKGEYLLFLGAGDLLLAGVLCKAQERVGSLATKKIYFIYGDVSYRSETRVGDGSFSKFRLCRRNICHQAIFYGEGIFQLLGPYDPRYPVYADWAFNLQCFARPEVQTIYWPVVVANYQGNGLSDKTQDFSFARDRVELIRASFGWLYAFGYRVYSQIRHRISQIRRALDHNIKAHEHEH